MGLSKLLLKSTLLLAPFVVGLAAAVAYVSWSPASREAVFHPEVEGRICACIAEDTAIIVAGDSGAMWQVVPQLMERRTGLRTCAAS